MARISAVSHQPPLFTPTAPPPPHGRQRVQTGGRGTTEECILRTSSWPTRANSDSAVELSVHVCCQGTDWGEFGPPIRIVRAG